MKIFFFVLVFAPSLLFAAANPINGEWQTSHIDLQTKNGLIPFKIQRDYNHKLQGLGVFGRSWCSQLDEQVVFSNMGLELRKCGQPTTGIYSKVDDLYLSASGSEAIQILPQQLGFVRLTADYVYAYNAEGRLAAIATKKGAEKPQVQIYYSKKSNMIEKVVHNNKDHYLFVFDQNSKLLTQIQGPGKLKVTYQYDDKNNLLAVNNAWGKNIQYTYDQQNRMTAVQMPEGVVQIITYNGQNMVTAVENENKCKTSFVYKMDVQTAKMSAVVTDSCANTTQNFASSSSSIFFKNRSDRSAMARIPASVNPFIAETFGGWKNFIHAGIRWSYYENELGHILQIKETHLGTNKVRLLNVKYKNQKLSELDIDGDKAIIFSYKNNKMSSMKPKNPNAPEKFKAFRVFAQFLSAKMETQ